MCADADEVFLFAELFIPLQKKTHGDLLVGKEFEELALKFAQTEAVAI